MRHEASCDDHDEDDGEIGHDDEMMLGIKNSYE